MNGFRIAKLFGVVDGMESNDPGVQTAVASRMILEADEPGTFIIIPAESLDEFITIDARLKVEVQE